MSDNWEMKDDELDSLFREAYSDMPKPECRQEDWDNFRAKFQAKPSSNNRKWWLGMGALALLVSVYTCTNDFIQKNRSETSKLSKKENQESITTKIASYNKEKQVLNPKNGQTEPQINSKSEPSVTEQPRLVETEDKANNSTTLSKEITKENNKIAAVVEPKEGLEIKLHEEKQSVSSEKLSVKSQKIDGQETIETTDNQGIGKNNTQITAESSIKNINTQKQLTKKERKNYSVQKGKKVVVGLAMSNTPKTNVKQSGSYGNLATANTENEIVNNLTTPTQNIDKGLENEVVESKIKTPNLLVPVEMSEIPPFLVMMRAVTTPIDTSIAKTKKTPDIKRPRWSVRVVYTPEWNAAVSMADQKTSSDGFGISLDYRFLKRVRVNTGVQYVTKKYTAPLEAYTVPATGFWKYSVKPLSMNVVCKVVDIPLNLRFDVVRRPRSDWFVSLGTSSFLMIQEDYDFIYPAKYNPTTNHLTWNYSAHRSGDHWFKICNFSLGYEYLTRRGMGFQIEPYIKIPTTGVGIGQIKLYATGVQLAFKYK